MYKKRTDIIDILEHLGRTGGKFPDYLSSKEIEDLKKNRGKYYDCLDRYPFEKDIKLAYDKRDNELLMKNLYLLMGYHLFEHINGDKWGFGSPTLLWIDFKINFGFDYDILNFLRMFVVFNGGNYYYRADNSYLNIEPKPYEELFQKIKNRDLNKYFDEIEKRKEEEKKAAENRKRKEQEYRDWLTKQDWYPEYIQVNQAKEEISKSKQFKKGLESKIESLKDQIKINQEQQVKLEVIYNKKYNDLKRKRNLSNLKDKTSSEILAFILEAEEPFDLYEPLASKIDIVEIKSLSQEKLEKFKDKASKSNKKSGFRKLLKELLKLGS